MRTAASATSILIIGPRAFVRKIRPPSARVSIPRVSPKRRRASPARPRTPPSRVSGGKILAHLRLAAKKGDRNALELALGQMRTLALSPRYWEKYLVLLRNPLARLVDLITIKQGERIAHQKGWKLPRPSAADGAAKSRKRKTPPRRPAARAPDTRQPSLFDLV